MRRIVCALGFIGLFACSEPSLTEKKVLALKKMDLLITADHLISDIFPVPDTKVPDAQWLWGSAHIKAGIDLRTLSAKQLEIDQKSIRITLPAPQILSVDTESSPIRKAYSSENLSEGLRTQAMLQFKKNILTTATIKAIQDEAASKASSFLSDYLRQQGFTRIRIKFDATLQSPSTILP